MIPRRNQTTFGTSGARTARRTGDRWGSNYRGADNERRGWRGGSQVVPSRELGTHANQLAVTSKSQVLAHGCIDLSQGCAGTTLNSPSLLLIFERRAKGFNRVIHVPAVNCMRRVEDVWFIPRPFSRISKKRCFGADECRFVRPYYYCFDLFS